MRSTFDSARALGCAVLFAAGVAGQGKENTFEIYPDPEGNTSSFTTRNGIAADKAGEILQEVAGGYFAGIGDDGTACKATSFRGVLQDQDESTQEPFKIVVRKSLGWQQPPMVGDAGVIVRAGPFMPPVGPKGPGVWTLTFRFADPLKLPCVPNGFYMGLELPANAAWPADGLSVHAAFYAPDGDEGDEALPGAPNHAWRIVDGVAARAASGRNMRVALLTDAAVLNVGTIVPGSARLPANQSTYGAGGLYPVVKTGARDDGVTARILDRTNAGGTAYVFVAWNDTYAQVKWPGFSGSLYLGRGGLSPIWYLGQAMIDANGEANLLLAPPRTIPATIKGFAVQVQAITHDAARANWRFTNFTGNSFRNY